MLFEGHLAHQGGDIAIGLVQIALLEFLHHHLSLHIDLLVVEHQVAHSVGLHTESKLGITARQRYKIVREIVVGKCVTIGASLFQGLVERRETLSALEHQVFEQMGQTRVLILLVLGANTIEDVHMNHFGALVEYLHQTQTIIE